VKGYRAVPWQRLSRESDREEIIRLSGTPEVPILVLDDGTVISDSRRIVRWAREHPAA
jgi:glutathione S-transferase